MTDWVNMFDGGACTVGCHLKNPTEDEILWSGTLGKGASSPTFAGRNDFGLLQISVDAAGVVSLISPDDSWTSNFTYALFVTPQYDVSALQTQMADASFPGSSSGNTSQASNNGDVEAGTECAIGAAGAMTPSTIAFGPLADASLSLWSAGS